MMPLMAMPRIAEAAASASAGVPASFTPPALPRPPDEDLGLDHDP